MDFNEEKLKKLGEDFRGVTGIYKPKGMSSAQLVARVKRVTQADRVGHAGTLDPLADGVLVVGVGREFTRQLGGWLGQEKEYEVIIRLGVSSDTDDLGGDVVKSENPRRCSQQEVEGEMQKFLGKIIQVPPVYSAVKVAGKEAYKRARKGELVKPEARVREVKQIELIEYIWPKISVRITTGSGVYIRSIARDLGDNLGVGGLVEELRRVRVGDISLVDCLRVEGLVVRLLKPRDAGAKDGGESGLDHR